MRISRPRHMGYFERLTSDEKEVVFSDYLRTLAEGGLTCTEKNLVKLTQDLYPIDATPDNIRKLSTDRDALNELHIDGMVLFYYRPCALIMEIIHAVLSLLRVKVTFF